MSRTYRRKNYRPEWVTQESGQFKDYRTGVLFWVWRVEIDDPKERQKKINWWHFDEKRQHWYCAPKDFRKEEERKHRTLCKEELHKYLRNEEYEVMILSQGKLPWWD